MRETTDVVSKTFINQMETLYEATVDRLPYVVAGLLILGAFWLIGRLIGGVFQMAYRRSLIDERLKVLIGRFISAIAIVIGVLSALTVAIPSLTVGEIIAGLGFTSFIIGFATKDILNNMLSGMLILWRRPFDVGDYLFVKDREGFVEHVGMRATALRLQSGEVALVPNGDIYTNPITIRTAGSRLRLTTVITVETSSDISTVKEILFESIAGLEGILNQPQPSVVISRIGREGLDYTLSAWIDTSRTDILALRDLILREITLSCVARGVKMFPATGTSE